MGTDHLIDELDGAGESIRLEAYAVVAGEEVVERVRLVEVGAADAGPLVILAVDEHGGLGCFWPGHGCGCGCGCCLGCDGDGDGDGGESDSATQRRRGGTSLRSGLCTRPPCEPAGSSIRVAAPRLERPRLAPRAPRELTPFPLALRSRAGLPGSIPRSASRSRAVPRSPTPPSPSRATAASATCSSPRASSSSPTSSPSSSRTSASRRPMSSSSSLPASRPPSRTGSS